MSAKLPEKGCYNCLHSMLDLLPFDVEGWFCSRVNKRKPKKVKDNHICSHWELDKNL